MLRYAVQTKDGFLANTKDRIYGALDEAILFETDPEAFMECRKMSRAKVVPVVLYVKKSTKEKK